MNGTQKMIVALVAIFVAAGVVVGGFVVLGGSDDSPSVAPASYPPPAVPTDTSASYVAPPAVPAPAVNQQPVKLSRPTGVRASVTSGNTVLVRWNYPSNNYVRYFQVFDDGQTVGGKTPPNQRRIFVTASYRTHCYRVLAVAVAGARSSNASSCGTVTVAKPYNPPPGSYNPPPSGSANPPPSGSANPPPS